MKRLNKNVMISKRTVEAMAACATACPFCRCDCFGNYMLYGSIHNSRFTILTTRLRSVTKSVGQY